MEQQCSAWFYSRPITKLIPWTRPMMMGCQATRYLSQSRSCPYRTCVFSQLGGYIKDQAVNGRGLRHGQTLKQTGYGLFIILFKSTFSLQ